ncbi:MAG: hypothetical protein K9L88_01375 [Chromatiaceae bacterium]|nr:hypothetical protein [Chromatiaceae bacterium]
MTILDVYRRKIVATGVFHTESAHHAAQVIRRTVLSEGQVDRPLVRHADSGNSFKAASLFTTLHALNNTPSFTRPRVSTFRICKCRPYYPVNGFNNLHSGLRWVHGFVGWYNREHRDSAMPFVTPQQRHRGEDRPILARGAMPSTRGRATDTPSAGAAPHAIGPRSASSRSTRSASPNSRRTTSPRVMSGDATTCSMVAPCKGSPLALTNWEAGTRCRNYLPGSFAICIPSTFSTLNTKR